MAWTEANFQTTIGNVASNHGGLTAIKSIAATPYLNASDPVYNGGFKVLVIMNDGFQYSFLRQAQDKGGFDTFMGILKATTGNNSNPVNQSIANVTGTIATTSTGMMEVGGVVGPLLGNIKSEAAKIPVVGGFLAKGQNALIATAAIFVAVWYFFFKKKKRGGRRRRRRR